MTTLTPVGQTHPQDPQPAEIPEPGQVVEVRGSTWAVSNVRAQGLPRSPADESRAETHHVVSLQSLDEDRLGEELDVVTGSLRWGTRLPRIGASGGHHVRGFR